VAKKNSDTCEHDLRKEYDHGMDTGDSVCSHCGETFTPAEVRAMSAPRDVVTNAKRVFDEFIERSEQPPNRGNLKKVAPPPAKKNGATK
jgi:hypothetical protein